MSVSAVQSRTSKEDDDVPIRSSSADVIPQKEGQGLTEETSDPTSSSSDSSDDVGEKIEKKKSKKRKSISQMDFKKISLIGRGNVGRVYLVEKENELYSMKVIDKKKIQERMNEQRIESERNILKKISHPFIVHMFHDFETSLHHFYVMTYCAGGDFWRLLHKQRGKCFKESTAKFYLAEIVCALEYLHMEGIVYRDLKPENILLTDSGHIMLSDFDLSKHSVEFQEAKVESSFFGGDEIVVEPSTFRSNSFVGTNEYLAPEILGKHGHSASVDWWTLGILMYEFLYGCNPFTSSCIQETHENILNGIYSFPKNHFNKVSKEAKDLIKGLLEVDCEDRLGSKTGALEIKKHKFFANIQFQLIRNMTPPIIPRLENERDISYFPKYEKYDDDIPDDWGYAEEKKRKRTKAMKKGLTKGNPKGLKKKKRDSPRKQAEE